MENVISNDDLKSSNFQSEFHCIMEVTVNYMHKCVCDKSKVNYLFYRIEFDVNNKHKYLNYFFFSLIYHF